MKSFYIAVSIILLTVFSSLSGFSQCTSCTYTITGNDGNYYTLNAGQTLCIASGGNFSGGVGLNGGTICNNGRITGGYISFNSGSFYNNGTISGGGLGMSSGVFQNNGTISGGNFNFNGGSVYNNGTLSGGNSTLGGATFYNYGNLTSGAGFNLNSGTFNNYSPWTLSGGLNFGATINNYSDITVNGDLNINNGGVFNNYASHNLYVTGNLNNNYKFYNYGNVSVNGSYSANSNSVNENYSSIKLQGNFNVNSAFTNNGTMTVAGYVRVNSSGSLTIGTNSKLQVKGSYENNSLTLNNGTIDVEGNFTNNSSGNFVNNSAITVLGNFVNNGPISGDNVGCNLFSVFGSNIVQNSSGSMTSIDFCGNAVPGNFTKNYGSVSSNVTFCSCTQSGGGVSPLPIILKSFTATCADEEVAIDWVTVTEINNAFFTISRSEDAANWEPIHVQAGAGSSNAELSYTCLDTRPVRGTSYYRLQQTDLDGTTKYFSPISVSCDAKANAAGISVFPNPANEQFTVSVQAVREDAQAIIELTDFAGRKTFSKIAGLSVGSNPIQLERNGLAAGTYLVRVISQGEVLGVQKVVLQ